MSRAKSQSPIPDNTVSRFGKLKQRLDLKKVAGTTNTERSTSPLTSFTAEMPPKNEGNVNRMRRISSTQRFMNNTLFSRHRRQKSTGSPSFSIEQTLQSDEMSPNSTRQSRSPTLSGSFDINELPDSIKPISNFSSPTKSIRSRDSDDYHPSSFEAVQREVSIPRIINFTPEDEKSLEMSLNDSPFGFFNSKNRLISESRRDDTTPSRFSKLRKKTLSMFSDAETNNVPSTTPTSISTRSSQQQYDQQAEQIFVVDSTPSIVIDPSPALKSQDTGSSSLGRPKLAKSHSENEKTNIRNSSKSLLTFTEHSPSHISPEKDLARKRSKTVGENDLYCKSNTVNSTTNSSIVKTIGSMMLMRPKSSSITDGSPSPTLENPPGLNHESVTPVRPVTPPEPQENEIPESYVNRLRDEGFDFEATSIFSEKDSGFLKACLDHHIASKFSFYGEPLDIALRKLLIQCELPRETQQIDRTLESFSIHYFNCNKDLWDSYDQIYFVTFSLVMLHTDYFNSNNRKKMSRSDFVKNTRVDSSQDAKISNTGILTKEMLEYFYDNITYTKFISNGNPLTPQSAYSLPKKIFSSTSSTNLEGMVSNSKPFSPNHQHSLSSTSQFFGSSTAFDPYWYINTDQVETLRLNLDFINFDNPFEGSFKDFLHSYRLFEVRKRLLSYDGLYFRFNRECNWLSIKTEVKFENVEDIEYSTRNVLKVIKVGELGKEEKKVNSKFFTIGTSTKAMWKKVYGVLTTCGFFIFDNLNFISLPDREKLLSGNFDNDLIVDILSDSALRSCSKLVINGLFACRSTTDDHLTFNIFSKNKKELFFAKSYEELEDWIVSINYISALDNCFIDVEGYHDHQVVSFRSLNVEEKINKLATNIPLSVEKVSNLLRIGRHLSILTPFQQKTKEALMIHCKMLGIRIDWLWYEIERNSVCNDILQLELRRDDALSLNTEANDSFLEDSFINGDEEFVKSANPSSFLDEVLSNNESRPYVDKRTEAIKRSSPYTSEQNAWTQNSLVPLTSRLNIYHDDDTSIMTDTEADDTMYTDARSSAESF